MLGVSESAYNCKPADRPLDAVVTVPGSKSITNRALIVAALADGTSILSNLLLADDTRLMFEALRSLGIRITVDESECLAEVSGCRGLLPVSESKLDCGNAGTVMRFCTALVSLGQGRFELDGVARMRQRPIGGLVDVLQALGAGVEFLDRQGYPPLAVHANGLTGGHIEFRSPPSSQFVSAVLLVAPYAARDVLVDVTGKVTSKPYLRLTASVMGAFGVPVIAQYRQDEAKFIVAAPQRYGATTYAVEPDASNSTYFLAAPAIAGGRITVEGLGTASDQGDARFVDVLERMGCLIERKPDRLTVYGPENDAPLHGIDIDLNDMPDTVQTLAVLALFADGPTTIRNVANLRVKETDRLAALQKELTKLGAHVEERPDGLKIEPPRMIAPATIDTYNDHRMAMSFVLAGLRAEGVIIRNPGCSAKTFPDFFQRFEGLATVS